MTDWRGERDQALLVLEREKRADLREQAAHVLEQLFSGDEERRADALELVPRLIADKQGSVRRRGVAIAARSLPEDEVERFLGQRLADPDEGVRIEAAGQLADLVRPSARPVLAAALQDEAFPVRFEAARGMAALEHSAGLEVLLEALAHDHFRFRALGALGELGNPEAVPAVRRLFRRWLLSAFDRTQAAGVLAKFGDPEGAQHLIKRARAKRWAMDRALAVELCGELKVPDAFEHLSELLGNAKDESRGAAARGLGRLKDPRALPLLARLLTDEAAREDVRLDAAEGLAILGLPQGREEIVRALPKFTSLEAREVLTELLSEAFGQGNER